MNDFVLAKVQPAVRMLQAATTPREAKKVADMAKAAKVYAQRQKLGKEAELYAHQIVIDAETLLGSFLANTPKAGPAFTRGGGSKGSKREPLPNAPAKLDDVGISKKESSNGQFLAKLKEDKPDLHDDIRNRKKNVSQVRRELKRTTTITKLEEVAAREPDAPVGKFDVIVIDPPWPMEKIERDCRPNQTSDLDYPTMRLGDISNLTIIKDHAAYDCHVFLWTTQKFLPVSFFILEQWGLGYGFTMVWHKPGGFQPVGLPQFNCEFCIYARRGNPIFADTKAFNLCNEWPRTKHSEKPEGFYDLLSRVTAGRRLDVFNRRKLDGFIGWGKEAA